MLCRVYYKILSRGRITLIENAGYGAGGTVVGAILVWLGFKSRLDRIDKDIDDLKSGVVWEKTCLATHAASMQRLDAIDKKLEILIDRREKSR